MHLFCPFLLLSSAGASGSAPERQRRVAVQGDDKGDALCLLQGRAFIEKTLSTWAPTAATKQRELRPLLVQQGSSMTNRSLLDESSFDLWAQHDDCCEGSDEVLERKTGIVFNGYGEERSRQTDDDGVKYWDLTSTFLEAKDTSTVRSEGDAYTHAFVLKWSRATPPGTYMMNLVKNQGPNMTESEYDMCGGVLMNGRGSSTLGMYSYRSSGIVLNCDDDASGICEPTAGFRSTGYDIGEPASHDRWEILVYTGEVSTGFLSSEYDGTTTFYMQEPTGEMLQVGTADSVCSGLKFYRLGEDLGKLSRVLMWDRVLLPDEVDELPSLLGNTGAGGWQPGGDLRPNLEEESNVFENVNPGGNISPGGNIAPDVGSNAGGEESADEEFATSPPDVDANEGGLTNGASDDVEDTLNGTTTSSGSSGVDDSANDGPPVAPPVAPVTGYANDYFSRYEQFNNR